PGPSGQTPATQQATPRPSRARVMTPMPTTMRKDWHEHLRGDRGDHRSRPRAAWGGRPDPAHRPAAAAAPARNGPRRRWGWGAEEPDRRDDPQPAGALVRRLRGDR